MKKKLLKAVSIFVIVAMLLMDLPQFEGGAEWLDIIATTCREVFAATTPQTTTGYYFLLSADPVTNGGEIDYSKFSTSELTLNIMLGGATVPSGASITWNISNENVIERRSSSSTEITLNILSPGYSTLIASMYDPDGTFHSAIAYCTIHVPLEYDDLNNIKATNSNPYGLIVAQNGEKNAAYTLQLYTNNSAAHPDAYHYLRKLKYINYASTVSGEAVTSAIAPDRLATPMTALAWSSSDPSVVEVDEDTGMIRALHSGFARVTVKTKTDSGLNDGDTLTFNVVVVPEAYAVGYTTDYANDFIFYSNVNDREIVIQTDARYAQVLKWQLFQGDTASQSAEITKNYTSKINISDATGRVTLTDMPAGVYCLTAIPVKDSTAAANLSTYDVIGANIQYLKIVIVVTLNLPTDTLIMNYYSDSVSDCYDLLENSNIPAGTFRFSSSDTTVARVGTTDGLIEATGLGNCVITINRVSDAAIRKVFGNYAATAAAAIASGAPYNINVTVVNGVALNTTSATMTQGSKMQLLLTAPNPYEGEMIWSSSKTNVVTVDEAGLVTAVGAGECTVTVKIKVGGITKRAQCKISVISAVNSIQLTSKFDFVEVGDNLTISAQIAPAVAGVTLTWHCSDEKLAAVTDRSPLSCTITGVKPGTVVITAVNPANEIVGSKIIKVIQPVTGISLSDKEVTIPLSQGYYQLYATCTPELPSNQSLKWSSSNTKLATVDENGKVKLIKTGTVVINCITENGLQAQCTFIITQGVTSIKMDVAEVTIYVGEKYRMTYTVLPANASNVQLKWSVQDSKIATVDNSGYIVGKNVGTTLVIASATDGSGIYAMAKIIVLRNAKSIKLDVTNLVMNVGEIYTLEVTLTPADSSDSLTFESSNTKVATVSKTGKITAKAKGTTVVMVKTSGNVTAYCTVMVNQQVTGVKLNFEEVTIFAGDTFTLEAEIEPKTASDTDVTWTTGDPSVCKVDKMGVLSAIAGGMTMITCTTMDGDYMAYCIVTVMEPVTLIEIPEYMEVGVGKKKTIEAKVSGETASNKELEWDSSDPSICKINTKGVITGVRLGKVTITATAKDGSGSYAECEVTVIIATDSIDIDPESQYIELIVGQSETIQYRTDPTPTTYSPVWTSEDESIAIVNKSGKVTGIKAGTTWVHATAKDDPNVVSDMVCVLVKNPVYARSITFSESEIIMTPGEQRTVTPAFNPSNFTESYTWSIDDKTVAEVDEEDGTITAHEVGVATVTVMTKSGVKGSCKIFVVGLSRDEIVLYQYQTTEIALEIDGSGANKLTLRWDTDNQNIASLSGRTKCTVTGKTIGETTIYAVVNSRRLPCKVIVKKNPKTTGKK